MLILAGLAGSLSRRLVPGTAHVVRSVFTKEGEVNCTALLLDWPDDAAKVSITSVMSAVRTPDGRDSLHAQSGAELVDLESVEFAQQATQRGIPWLIVRGVSDGFDDELPEGINRWVDERGVVRVWTVIRDTVFRPDAMRVLYRLNAQSRVAMDAVASYINRLPRSAGAD